MLSVIFFFVRVQFQVEGENSNMRIHSLNMLTWYRPIKWEGFENTSKNFSNNIWGAHCGLKKTSFCKSYTMLRSDKCKAWGTFLAKFSPTFSFRKPLGVQSIILKLFQSKLYRTSSITNICTRIDLNRKYRSIHTKISFR